MTPQKLIGLFLTIVTFGFTNDTSYVIRPGIGSDKLFIGQRIKDVFVLLGKNDKFTEGITDYDNRDAVHTNRYIYSKLGLTFVTNTDESKGQNLEKATVDNILFQFPAAATVKDGITLGQDTKEKIVSVFGRQDADQDSYADILYFHYRKKGISFGVDSKTKKVTTIEVYKKNNYPDND
jgi:hypothetical protein